MTGRASRRPRAGPEPGGDDGGRPVIASKRRWLLAFGLVGAVAVSALAILLMRSRPTVTMLEPPGRDSVAGITGDTAILVSGRRVTPAGRVVRVQSYNWG